MGPPLYQPVDDWSIRGQDGRFYDSFSDRADSEVESLDNLGRKLRRKKKKLAKKFKEVKNDERMVRRAKEVVEDDRRRPKRSKHRRRSRSRDRSPREPRVTNIFYPAPEPPNWHGMGAYGPYSSEPPHQGVFGEPSRNLHGVYRTVRDATYDAIADQMQNLNVNSTRQPAIIDAPLPSPRVKSSSYAYNYPSGHHHYSYRPNADEAAAFRAGERFGAREERAAGFNEAAAFRAGEKLGAREERAAASRERYVAEKSPRFPVSETRRAWGGMGCGRRDCPSYKPSPGGPLVGYPCGYCDGMYGVRYGRS